jgi:geranylgeranyl diphosphate synthase type II
MAPGVAVGFLGGAVGPTRSYFLLSDCLMLQVSDPSILTSPAREMVRQVEAALDEYTRLPEGCPAPLAQAIRYSLLAPGKRLRPLLVLSAAQACDGTIEAALPAACAVEMVHAYSLIHDDLPAMDDDDLRRGRPTNHKVFGEALAILAGDALLTLAFETLARHVRPAATAAACCAALATAAGAAALVGGQVDDLDAEKFGGGLERLESIHARKTGAMMNVSLRLGGLIAGADDARLAALDLYGRRMGLAFQIMDDLLDVRGDEHAVGKRLGKDMQRGKLTFPGLLGIEESHRRARDLIAAARDAIAPLGPSAEGLDALALYVLERDR